MLYEDVRAEWICDFWELKIAISSKADHTCVMFPSS